jgi:anthranilate synthase/aminodeoxychorismate synthase-like glutamine amidotransferase
MIAVIDNYDSFTYNLVQYLGELGAEIQVFRNDAVTVDELEALGADRLVVSPGPGTPDDGGISKEAIRKLHTRMPVLGVCLGHQCIAEVFGGDVGPAPRLMHGKTSEIHHSGGGILAGMPRPFTATRYHSLIVREPVPTELEVTAVTELDEVMAVAHRVLPTFGVQFHPESILTPEGKTLLAAFLAVQMPEEGYDGH